MLPSSELNSTMASLPASSIGTAPILIDPASVEPKSWFASTRSAWIPPFSDLSVTMGLKIVSAWIEPILHPTSTCGDSIVANFTEPNSE